MIKKNKPLDAYDFAEMKAAHCTIFNEKKLATLKKQICINQKEINTQEKVKNDLIKQNNQRLIDLEQMNYKVAQAEEKYRLITQKICDSENESLKIRTKIKELNREVDELVSTKKIVQQDINSEQSQLEFLSTQIKIQMEKEKDISKKCEEIENLRIEKVNEALEYQQKITQCTNEIKNKQTVIDNLKKEIIDYENKKDKVKKDHEEFIKKVNQSQKNLEEILAKINEAKAEYKQLQEKNTELTKENTELSQENSILMTQRAQINERIIEEKAKIEQKQNEFNSLIDELKELNEKKIQSKNELSNILDDISNNLKIQNETQLKTCQLRNKQTETEQELINLRQEYSMILEHISSTQKIHHELMSEIASTASNQKEISDQTNKVKNNLLESMSPKSRIKISSNVLTTPKISDLTNINSPTPKLQGNIATADLNESVIPK